MVEALNHNVPLLTDKISDFLRKFYKFKLCHVSPVVSVTETETLEHNKVHMSQSLWSAIPNFAQQGKFQLALLRKK